jgi:Cu-Zn family superoxide dismutase
MSNTIKSANKTNKKHKSHVKRAFVYDSTQKCTKAICVLNSQHYSGQGIVTFHQCSQTNQVQVNFLFKHLIPNKTYAIHIHQYGDLTKGCESLGGHWNPHNTTHGSLLYPNEPRHAGDLINNIKTNKNGSFTFSYVDDAIRLRGKYSIIGRSIVLHEDEDDLGRGKTEQSLQNGNSGKRILWGVIGVSM